MLLVKEAWSTVEPTARCWDLYSVLNPIARICRIAGVFPLTLEGPVGKRKYSTSRVLIIYSLTVLVLTVTALYKWTDHSNERHEKMSNYPVVDMSLKFEAVLEMCSVVITVLTVILGKDKFANAIDSLILQDISLQQKLGTKLDYAADSKQRHIQLGIIVSIIVMLFTYDFAHQMNFNITHSLNWITWVCPNIIRIASACLFVDVVAILNKRFGALNEHLRKLFEETTGSPTSMISTPCKMCETIRSIATIHGSLCDITLRVNQIFSYNIIAGVIYVLVMLTICVYYMFKEILDSNGSYADVLGCVSWAIITCGYIFYTVTACHFAQDQARLAGKLIHKFQISGVNTPLNNVVHTTMHILRHIRSKIQSFSLQLHHEKIEFSGGGFFPLNASLIQSILGVVTTYLVILLQFDKLTIPQTITLSGGNESLT